MGDMGVDSLSRGPFGLSRECSISGIDANANLLSQLSADVIQMVVTMLTGLSNVRSMALWRSLSSELGGFDMRRVSGCSVYKCQALFVERYRQNLFDEKYKALQQPQLIRALSSEPRNLSEFQEERVRRVDVRKSKKMRYAVEVEMESEMDVDSDSLSVCSPPTM